MVRREEITTGEAVVGIISKQGAEGGSREQAGLSSDGVECLALAAAITPGVTGSLDYRKLALPQ
jgi:hypothetical protein